VTPLCCWCGEPEVLEISEIYTDGNYTLDTCCAGLLERIAADMADDPAWGRDLLRRLGAELLTGQRLRRVCDETGTTTMLDYKLEVRPISFRDAARVVARHHAHCGPPLMHRFSLGVWNGRWSLLGVFSKIISYVRADEGGVSLRAAGWTKEADVPGRGWHGALRPRSNGNNAFVAKVRWSRTLRPKPKAPATLPHAEPAALPDWARIGDAGPGPCWSAPLG